ncbi:MAG: hypothetical protein ACI9B8_003547 [Sulfitobacter sp.]|jgi:hypothetical protein
MQGTDLITVSKTEETIDATSGLSLTKAFIGSVNATFTDEGEGLDLGLTTLNLERNATTAAATGTFTLDIGFTELAGTAVQVPAGQLTAGELNFGTVDEDGIVRYSDGSVQSLPAAINH